MTTITTVNLDEATRIKLAEMAHQVTNGNRSALMRRLIELARVVDVPATRKALTLDANGGGDKSQAVKEAQHV